MRFSQSSLAFFSMAVLFGWTMPTTVRAQQGERTYRVILYLAEEGAPAQVEIRRLDEVWSTGDDTRRLQELLASGPIRRLQEVTLVPGEETPAIRFGEVTFRIRGVLKEPRRSSMFLRVEVDGGREALVKEMISGFDETIVLAYPLTEGSRSVVALLIPVQVGN